MHSRGYLMDDPYIDNATERSMDKQTRKALELALDAIDELAYCSSSHAADDIKFHAIAAINAALSAPAAPVAQTAGRWTGDDAIESPHNACQHRGYCLSLKAAPRAPLTLDQKRAMWVMATIDLQSHENCYVRGIEDAERAHGIGQEGGAA